MLWSSIILYALILFPISLPDIVFFALILCLDETKKNNNHSENCTIFQTNNDYNYSRIKHYIVFSRSMCLAILRIKIYICIVWKALCCVNKYYLRVKK